MNLDTETVTTIPPLEVLKEETVPVKDVMVCAEEMAAATLCKQEVK